MNLSTGETDALFGVASVNSQLDVAVLMRIENNCVADRRGNTKILQHHQLSLMRSY